MYINELIFKQNENIFINCIKCISEHSRCRINWIVLNKIGIESTNSSNKNATVGRDEPERIYVWLFEHTHDFREQIIAPLDKF